MFSFFSVSARVAALLLYLQLLVSFSRTSSAFARRAEGHDSQRSALLQTGPRSSSSTRRVADHPYKITIRNRSPSRSRSLDLYARSQEQNAHPSIEATTRPTSSTRRTPSVEVVEHIIEPRHRSPLRYGVAPGRGSGFPGGLNPLSGFIGAGATRGSPTSAGGRGGGSLSRFPPSTTAHFAGPSPGMFQAMIMGQTFAGRGRNHVTLQNPQVFQIQPARGRSASPSRGIFASPRAAPSPPGSTSEDDSSPVAGRCASFWSKPKPLVCAAYALGALVLVGGPIWAANKVFGAAPLGGVASAVASVGSPLANQLGGMNLGQKQAHSSFLELAECDGSFFNLGAEYGIHSGLPERVERYLESSGDVMTLQVMPLQVDSESIAEQQRAPHSSRSTSSFSSSAGPSRSGAPFLKLNPADDGRSPMDVEDNWQWEYARIRQCPASATPSSAREEKYLLEVLENQNNAGNRRKVFACARLNILEPEQPSTTKSDTAATTGIQAQGDAAPASSDTSTVGADLLNAQMGNGFFASLTDADLMAAGETASAASPAPLAKQEPRGAMNTYRILVPIPIEDVWIPKRISSPSLEPICDNFHRYRKRIAEAFNKMATSVAIQDEHVVASSSSGDHGRGLLSSKSTSPAAPGQRRVQLQSSSSFPKHAKRSGAFLSTRRLEDDVARSTARRGDAEESTTKGTDVDVDSSTVVLPIPALSDLPLWVLPRKWGLRTEFCESDFPARGTADISIDEAYRKLHLGIWGWGIVNRLHPTGAQLLDETSNHSAEKDSVLDQVEPDERTSDVLGNYERSSEDLNNNDIKGSSTSGEAKAAQETTRKRSLEDDEAGDTSTSTESSSTDTGSEMKQEEQLQLVEAKNEKGRRIFLPLNFYRYSPPSEDLISQEKYHLREELFFCYNNYGDPKMRAKIENSDYGQFSPAWVGDPAKKPLPPLSRQFLHEMDPETGTDVWTSEDKPLPPTPVDV